jgi:hypothetical protein
MLGLRRTVMRSVSAPRWMYNVCCLGAFGTISEPAHATLRRFGTRSLMQPRYSTEVRLRRNTLLRSGVLVMLPSLLSSMYARDTASAEWLAYGRIGLAFRYRHAFVRRRIIER